MSPSLIGTAVPVDPGEHEVTATAPGKKPWRRKVVVEPDGHLVTVSIPSLESGKNFRGVGVVITGVGLLGLGVAAGLTAWAKIRLDDSNSGPGACTGNLCPPAGFNARTDAVTYGNVATGAWIGGGIVTAAGIGLLTASGVVRSQALRATVTPAASFDPRGGATLGVAGRF